MGRTSTSILLLLGLAASAQGLSWPLCEEGGAVWVTERPHTGALFPGADLWFFCRSGPNILGSPVDVCASSTDTVCSPSKAADGYCQMLGYDKAADQSYGGWAVGPVNATLTSLSLSGERCLRAGKYIPPTEQLPDNLAALEGEPCQALTQVACVRSTATMRAALQDAGVQLAGPAPAPEAAASGAVAVSSVGGNNRKLLLPGGTRSV